MNENSPCKRSKSGFYKEFEVSNQNSDIGNCHLGRCLETAKNESSVYLRDKINPKLPGGIAGMELGSPKNGLTPVGNCRDYECHQFSFERDVESTG